MRTTRHARLTVKVTLVLDKSKLARAREVLGTHGTSDTVNKALDEVLALAARRNLFERLRTMKGLELDDEAVMANAWRRNR